MNGKRELDQLIEIAEKYLSEAKALGLSSGELGRTVADVTDKHTIGTMVLAEIFLAHLGSSAFRLCTICKKTKNLNTRNKYYDGKKQRTQSNAVALMKQNLDEHIHFLLRDHVAHEENTQNDRATDRLQLVRSLTLQQALKGLDDCAKLVRTFV